MPAAKSQTSIRVDGLNRCLRILSKLPKDMQAEIRDESQAIATEEMVPAWQSAARMSGPMGEKQAASVRAKRDRVPAVSIGYARKAYSGGASTIMSRYPSHEGGEAAGRDSRGRFRPGARPPTYSATQWINAAKKYKGPAWRRWNDVLTDVVNEYGRKLATGG